MDNRTIGFFSLYGTEEVDSFVGALLITDENGIPLEFKCTQAVKPTAIQKSLYGDKLRPYIAITLSGIPLLDSVDEEPEILFINIPYVLDIRPQIEIPTILIWRAGESISFQEGEDDSEKQRVECDSGEFQAVVFQSHRDFKEESKDLNVSIRELFANFDLIEPFERMKRSVEILGASDPKYK